MVKGTGEYLGSGSGWNRGKGVTGIDWLNDKKQAGLHRERWRKKQNAKTLELAKNHRVEWTEAEDERIMDDSRSAYVHALDMGRTAVAIRNRRKVLMKRLEKELDVLGEQHKEGAEDRYAADLRSATLALIGVAVERGEADFYPMMSLCAMLGHFDDEAD
jgi:hypothetical protein